MQTIAKEDEDFWSNIDVTDLGCPIFQKTAKEYTIDMATKDLLPFDGSWRWLLLDQLRLYRTGAFVEFKTRSQTFQIEVNQILLEETNRLMQEAQDEC